MSYKELIYKNFYPKRIGKQKPSSIEKLWKNLPTYKNYIDRFFPKNGDFTHEIVFTRVSMSQVFLSNNFSRIKSYEDKPLVYSLSFVFRRILWNFFVRPLYIFLISVESVGCDKDIILTKNFTTIVQK